MSTQHIQGGQDYDDSLVTTAVEVPKAPSPLAAFFQRQADELNHLTNDDSWMEYAEVF